MIANWFQILQVCFVNSHLNDRIGIREALYIMDNLEQFEEHPTYQNRRQRPDSFFRYGESHFKILFS